MGTAEISTDNGAEQGIARASQTHGQREQGEGCLAGFESGFSKRLVGANAGVVVYVAGFGGADNGLNQ